MSKNNNYYNLPVAATLAALAAPRFTPEVTRTRDSTAVISPANQPAPFQLFHQEQVLQENNDQYFLDPNNELFMDEPEVFYSEDEYSDEENNNSDEETDLPTAIPAGQTRITDFFRPLRTDSEEDSADETTTSENGMTTSEDGSSSSQVISITETFRMDFSGESDFSENELL